MHFRDVWMILHDLVTLPNVKTHFVLSQYAISSRSNNANSRKWRKTSFLALWIIQKCISVMFEWSFMTWKHCRMLKTFSTITICNIKSIQQTKLRIMAKNLFFWHFGSFKNAFFVTFEWSNMCHIVEKLLRTFSIIKICNIKLIQWTKLEKTANNWMDHSNQPERVYPSNGKKCHGWSRFFPDMRFSRGGPRKALLSY